MNFFKNKKHLTLLILLIVFVLILIGFYFFNYNKPYNIYKKALSQTTNEKKVIIKSTLETSGDIEELSEKTINYSLDRDKKTIIVSKEGNVEGENSELLIYDNTLYLKINENKYVKITDSSYINEFTDNIKFESDNVYIEFQKEINASFDKNNIQKEKIEKTINDKPYKLTQLTLTVPKDSAKEIVKNYISKDFYDNMNNLVEETIQLQEESLKDTEDAFTNEEREDLKSEMISLLKKNLEHKIENMTFSDIVIKAAIDNKGYIRYREETYSIVIDGKKSTIKNTNEYLEFGKNIQNIDLNSVEIIEYSDYIKQEKEKNKAKTINYTIENPTEQIDFDKINKTDEITDTSQKENTEN